MRLRRCLFPLFLAAVCVGLGGCHRVPDEQAVRQALDAAEHAAETVDAGAFGDRLSDDFTGNHGELDRRQLVNLLRVARLAPEAFKPRDLWSAFEVRDLGMADATQGRVALPNNVWTNLQFEFRSSSTTSTQDGRLKIWANNNNYSAPNTQSGSIALSSRGWGRMSMGFYANATIRSGSRVVFQIADVEIDDQFDPNWSSGTTSSLPSTPTNLRVIVGAAQAIPIGGGLGALFFLRRRRVNG